MTSILKESNKAYHSNLAISKSSLVKMSVCPQYFKYCLDNPEPPTDELIFGSAFHKLTLEPTDFNKEFAVAPNVKRNTKEGKAIYDEFLLTSGDCEIITQEQYAAIQAMRDVVVDNKYARQLIQGEVETSMYFDDDLTGVPCKVRPDVYKTVKDRVVITDLKSCRSAQTLEFMRDVVKYGYDLQAAMYRIGASQVLGVPKENIDFVFIAVEKKPPYLINVLQADDFVFQRGEALFREYIGTYAECLKTGDWYGLNGITGVINNLSLPNYLINDNNK